MNNIKVGDILKLLREENGLTQDQLADMLNVKRQTYSAWERNVSNPDIETIVFLSNFFKVNTDYLLGKTNIRNYEAHTIAAHHDEEEWTEEELDEIEKFKEFVKAKRKK